MWGCREACCAGVWEAMHGLRATSPHASASAAACTRGATAAAPPPMATPLPAPRNLLTARRLHPSPRGQCLRHTNLPAAVSTTSGAAAIGQGPPVCCSRTLCTLSLSATLAIHPVPQSIQLYPLPLPQPLSADPACLLCPSAPTCRPPVSFAVAMARRRKSGEVEPADLMLHLQRKW